jgi:CBS domain-containing protein
VPRFFFHVRRHGRRVDDDEGAVHGDVQAALDEAVEGAREIVSSWIKAGDPVDAGGVVVTDEAGAVVGEVNFRDVVRTQ